MLLCVDINARPPHNNMKCALHVRRGSERLINKVIKTLADRIMDS